MSTELDERYEADLEAARGQRTGEGHLTTWAAWAIENMEEAYELSNTVEEYVANLDRQGFCEVAP